MRKTLDISDSALLETSPIDDLLDEANRVIGNEPPDVVCLPLVDFGGANYESRFIDRNLGPWSGSYDLGNIVERVRENYGSKIYLSIVTGMDFLDASPFKLRDQHNESKTGVCIVNPHIQKLLREVIKEAQDRFKPDGIVLDICDQYGQNAENGRIEFTCFCRYCSQGLSDMAKFDPKVFRTHPNPVNLTLKDTGTGIKHFNIPSNISTTELVAKSKTEGIFNPEWFSTEEVAEEWARSLIGFISARSKIVARAVSQIGQDARDKLSRI